MSPTAHAMDPKAALHARSVDNLKFSALVSGERMQEERLCYTLKWFDYRFMSPADATRLFVEAYKQAYRKHWRETRDLEQAEKKIGIRGDDWMSSSRELTSFWRARQHADILGVPYPFFIAHALRAAADRGAKNPPRPNQLFKMQNLARIHDEWEGWINDVLRPSELPAYRLENFLGLHAQIAHRDWVVDRIKAQHSRPYLIGQSVFLHRILPIERALVEFGDERVGEARREAHGSEPEPEAKLEKASMLPSCFGLPHASDSDTEPCSSCPVIGACMNMAARAKTRVFAGHGSEDPVKARKRALAAARQMKFRERRRHEGSRGTDAV